MAGTLTHFLVMKRYLEEKEEKEGKKAKKIKFGILNPELSCAFLGSSGPDIFYMKGDLGYVSDFHHYKNPGIFVKNLIESYPNDTNVKALAKGFLCHMATDLVIHPFVNSLVGKYQEHIMKEVDIPGVDMISGNFAAHNIVEFAQDYYVHTEVFKNSANPHLSIMTYGIKDVKSDLTKIFQETIQKTYDIKPDRKDIGKVLDFFIESNNPFALNIEDHPDIILDDKYMYKPFLEHQEKINSSYTDENSTFNKLVTKAVHLTGEMIQKMENTQWNDIIKTWNLDTGLQTVPSIQNNKIQLSFKSY